MATRFDSRPFWFASTNPDQHRCSSYITFFLSASPINTISPSAAYRTPLVLQSIPHHPTVLPLPPHPHLSVQYAGALRPRRQQPDHEDDLEVILFILIN